MEKTHNNTMKSNALEKQRKGNLSCSTSFWPWIFVFVFSLLSWETLPSCFSQTPCIGHRKPERGSQQTSTITHKSPQKAKTEA